MKNKLRFLLIFGLLFGGQVFATKILTKRKVYENRVSDDLQSPTMNKEEWEKWFPP